MRLRLVHTTYVQTDLDPEIAQYADIMDEEHKVIEMARTMFALAMGRTMRECETLAREALA